MNVVGDVAISSAGDPMPAAVLGPVPEAAVPASPVVLTPIAEASPRVETRIATPFFALIIGPHCAN